jgi:hypothetical protein
MCARVPIKINLDDARRNFVCFSIERSHLSLSAEEKNYVKRDGMRVRVSVRMWNVFNFL